MDYGADLLERWMNTTETRAVEVVGEPARHIYIDHELRHLPSREDSFDDQDFADWFTLYSAGVAEEMGLVDQPGGGYGEFDAARLVAECRRRFIGLSR